MSLSSKWVFVAEARADDYERVRTIVAAVRSLHCRVRFEDRESDDVRYTVILTLGHCVNEVLAELGRLGPTLGPMPSRTTVALPALQALRVKNALTQQGLAELAGLHRVTVAEIEGGRPANMATVQALAKALKCKPVDLMEG